MPSWLKFATYFLLASLFTFSIKKPVILWQNINLNDLLLGISFFCFLAALYKKQLACKIPRSVVFGVTTGIVLLLIGTFVSFIFFHQIAPSAIREYVRIGASIIILIEVYCIGFSDFKFIHKALFSLCAMTFILPFVFYIFPSAIPFFLDESQTRFSGFLLDPNYYASLQILPTFILLWIAFAHPLGKSRFISVIAILFFIMSAGSIIWSGSRGGLIGLIAGLLFLAVVMAWKLDWKKALFYIAIITIASIASFHIIPVTGKKNIEARISSIITAPTLRTVKTEPVPQKITEVKAFTGQQDRLSLWKSAFSEALKNPFGYGPGYPEVADIIGSYNDHHRVAHNTVLQIILSGGFALLILVCFGLYIVTKRALQPFITFGIPHYTLSALVGVGVAGLFLDSLWSRWVWIILGILIVVTSKKYQETK
jgi:hypothetical protein